MGPNVTRSTRIATSSRGTSRKFIRNISQPFVCAWGGAHVVYLGGITHQISALQSLLMRLFGWAGGP
eukprot:2891719-Ditylum_brightwellii.AAC.1